MNYLLLDAGDAFCWADCTWYWLWTLGAFLLGALLTWLLNRKHEVPYDNPEIIAQRDQYHANAAKWEKDFHTIKYQLEETQKTEADLRGALQHCNADKAMLEQEVLNVKASQAAAFGAGAGAAGTAALSGLTPAGYDNDPGEQTEAEPEENDGAETPALNITPDPAPTPPAKTPPTENRTGGAIILPGTSTDQEGEPPNPYVGMFDPDNLQIIQGIGPKVEQLLRDNDIADWSTLARATVEQLRAILTDAGKRYGLSDPSAWPHQAGLAAAGDFDKLIEYQKTTGPASGQPADLTNDSKFEKLLSRRLGFSSSNPKDLKVVEGIGPRIERILKDGGIGDWTALANADLESLQTALNAAGPRVKMAQPTTWAQQAALAMAGDWIALRALQEALRKGA